MCGCGCPSCLSLGYNLFFFLGLFCSIPFSQTCLISVSFFLRKLFCYTRKQNLLSVFTMEISWFLGPFVDVQSDLFLFFGRCPLCPRNDVRCFFQCHFFLLLYGQPFNRFSYVSTVKVVSPFSENGNFFQLVFFTFAATPVLGPFSL